MCAHMHARVCTVCVRTCMHACIHACVRACVYKHCAHQLTDLRRRADEAQQQVPGAHRVLAHKEAHLHACVSA